MSLFIPFIALVFLAVFYLWYIYNGLVTGKNRVKEAWSEIDVQSKRRADLIPNLIETVKGYAKHEKSVFENVTKARSALLSASSPKSMAQANNQVTEALKSLFAVAEGYPQLRASENFIQLQKELSDTEDKVAYARQFYNTSVLEYNNKILVFPNVLIANNLGFKEEEFFEAEEGDRKKVSVKFD